MSRSDILAGKSYVELYVKKSKFVNGLKDAQRRLQSFGSGMMGMGATIAAAGTAVVGTLVASVVQFARVGDALDKMSKRTGASVQFLAEMGFAAEQSGQSMETIEKGLIGVTKFVGDANRGLATAADGMDALGLATKDFEGLNAQEQFELVTGALEGIGDATERNQAAMLVFGKKMGPAIASITDGLSAARKEAQDLGLVPSDESIKEAAEVTDAINRVQRVVSATFFELGATFAPIAKTILADTLRIAKTTTKWVQANRPLVITIAKVAAGVAAAGATIIGMGAAVVGAGAAIGMIVSGITGLAAGAALIGSVGSALASIALPALAIAAGVGAAAAAVIYFTGSGGSLLKSMQGVWGSLVSKVSEGAAFLKQTLGGIFEALRAGDVQLAGEIAMTSLRLVVTKAIDAISGMFGGLWGDMTSTFLTQITGGDFAGAWDTVVLGMGEAWSALTTGITEAALGAASLVVDTWKGAVDDITNYILQKASEGGAFGAMFQQISGVDVGAEMARSAQLDAQMRERGMNPGESIADQIRSGTYEDPQVAALADGMTSALSSAIDANQAQRDARRAETQAAVGGATITNGTESERLTTMLAGMMARAAELRRERLGEANNARGPDGAPGTDDVAMGAPRSIAGFSSAAIIAQAQGAGGSPQVKAIEGLRKEARDIGKQTVEGLQMIQAGLSNLGLWHA